MICDMCAKDKARIQHVTRSYGKEDNLLIIENIPVIHCSHCRESYLTSDTLHEIERIKLHRKNFAKERPVPVAAFSEIAVNKNSPPPSFVMEKREKRQAP